VNGTHAGRRRRILTASAVGLVAGLPLLAFAVAPSAHADDSPGANLAGINASSYATAVQLAPLTPGIVGAGNVSQGNLFEVDIPYASTSTSTGPSNAGVASPVYPGDTAAGAGDALATFAPQLPAALVSALNDPVVARADYPAQVSVGSSSNYAPPGPAGTGVGNASADATPAGATSQSATSQSSLAGAVTVASSTASSATVLNASSVQASSHTDVGTIEIMGGLVKIAGLTSDASVTSDGNVGQPTSNFNLGAVTVAGTPASIGPNGITVASNSQGNILVPTVNQALSALKQGGISIYTIAPASTLDGASATITSGALVLAFQDANIPNPNGQVPVSSVGMDINIGLSQASADATALPPITPFPSSFGGSTSASSPSVGSVNSGVVSSPGTGGAVPVSAGGGGSLTAPGPSVASTGASTPGSPTSSGPAGNGASGPLVPIPPATLLGAPIKVAWVVIAFLLSLVVAGPLLGYANWQLLRGRKS
jgi:hypothetical protein